MKTRVLLLVASVCFQTSQAFSDSCEGQGTVFYYGNGRINATEKVARASLEELRKGIESRVSIDPSKRTEFDVAYKSSEPILTQLKNGVVQKKIENFETFWLWVSSLKESPAWFQEITRQGVADSFKVSFTDFSYLENHFESYSRAIRKGYNVVLVSHSQGNLYANQAMKKLEGFTDESLTGSLAEKSPKNALFPKFSDLFANVQVASPALTTIRSSPWSTFEDDLILNFVRTLSGALSPNLQTRGAGLPPDGDLLGHSFTKAYLRNKESRNKILNDISTQHQRLRYPIALFEKAVLIESHWHSAGRGKNSYSLDPDLFFTFVSETKHEIVSDAQDQQGEGEIISQNSINCFELPLGRSKIFLSVHRNRKDTNKEVYFEAWPEGRKEDRNGKRHPTIVRFTVDQEYSDWEVGTITAEKGEGKEPLKVKVEIYPQPIPKKPKDSGG